MINRRALLVGGASIPLTTAFERSAKAAWASFTAAAESGVAWANLPIVGGGFNTRIAVNKDGTLFTGVDVQGAYVRSSAGAGNDTWVQTQTATSLPSDYIPTPYAAGGCFEIAMDPQNSSNLLMFFGVSGRSLTTVLYSTNKGASWSHTGYGFTNDEPNQSGTPSAYNYHLNGQRMAIDPNNSNVWYVGNGSGLQVTTNGGVSFNAVGGGFPTGAGALGICIDPNSGTTGGITNTIWAASFGNGVYKSTNAGVTWTLISGSPSNVAHAKLGADGAYYANPVLGATNFYRIVGTTVSPITVGGSGCFCLAVDPVNPARLIGLSPYGSAIITLNNACNTGSPTATVGGASTSTSTDAPWMDVSKSLGGAGGGWDAADCVWDPLVTTSANSLTIAASGTLGPFTVGTNQNISVGDTLRVSNTGTFTNYMLGTVSAYTPATGSLTLTLGVSEGTGQYLGAASGGSGTFSAWTITKERIWVANGVGVCYFDAPTTGTNHVIDASFGIENLVGLLADVWPPNSPPVLTTADKPVWYIGNNPFTATVGQGGYGFTNQVGVVEWNFIAYAPANPATLIGSIAGPTAYKSTSGGVVGTVANGNATSWAALANQPPISNLFWAASTSLNYIAIPLGGTGPAIYTTDGGTTWHNSTGGPTSWLGGPFEGIQPICADSITAGTFYAYSGSTCYVSTDGGATWTAGSSSLTTGNFPKLKNPYGQAGHVWFTSGNASPSGSFASLAALNASHPVAQSFYFSSNGGSTFTALLNVLEVIDFAFSANAPGQSYNSLLVNGWVKYAGTYVYGWHRCDNFNPASPGTGSEVWTFLGAYPFNWYDTPVSAGGNPSRYNEWIAAFGGSGFKIFGSPSNPWP